MAFNAAKIMRPLSRLRRQLPLRRGAKESAAVVGRALPPLCKGRWVGHEVDEPVGLPVMFRCAGEPRQAVLDKGGRVVYTKYRRKRRYRTNG